MNAHKLRAAAYKKVPWKVQPYLEFLNYTFQNPLKFRKNANMFKYATSVYKKDAINYAPPIFSATISTVCNLRCPTCLFLLQNQNAFDNGAFIDVNDFKSIIEKYSRSITAVTLGGGEALLHPEFDKLVKIVRSNGLDVRASTNGVLIKKRISTLKFFDLINVSVDSYDYETFKRFRGGTKEEFDEILEGLRILAKNNLKFDVSFLLREDNINEIHDMINFAQNVRPNSITFININPHDNKKYRPITTSNENAMRILNEITSKNDYPFNIVLPVIFDEKSDLFKTSRCVQPWDYCNFDAKGNLSPCCFIQHNERFGNIFKDYDLNADEMRKFRRSMIDGKYISYCVYCGGRFKGKHYGRFDSRLKKWV